MTERLELQFTPKTQQELSLKFPFKEQINTKSKEPCFTGPPRLQIREPIAARSLENENESESRNETELSRRPSIILRLNQSNLTHQDVAGDRAQYVKSEDMNDLRPGFGTGPTTERVSPPVMSLSNTLRQPVNTDSREKSISLRPIQIRCTTPGSIPIQNISAADEKRILRLGQSQQRSVTPSQLTFAHHTNMASLKTRANQQLVKNISIHQQDRANRKEAIKKLKVAKASEDQAELSPEATPAPLPN